MRRAHLDNDPKARQTLSYAAIGLGKPGEGPGSILLENGVKDPIEQQEAASRTMLILNSSPSSGPARP